MLNYADPPSPVLLTLMLNKGDVLSATGVRTSTETSTGSTMESIQTAGEKSGKGNTLLLFISSWLIPWTIFSVLLIELDVRVK